MNSLVLLNKSIKYQILIYFRIKQAVFFAIAFPVFLYLIFGSIWGNSSGYTQFLLSGIIGMAIASDGLFAVGPVIRDYYANGLIKYLRKMPFNILIHFVGLIVSRILSLFLTLIILCFVSYIFFGHIVTIKELLNYVLGIIIGLAVFSFIGLCLSFSGIKSGTEKGLANLIYFILLFTSSAFYPIKSFNELIGALGDYLPLNPLLYILRGESTGIPVLLFWLIVPIFIFYILFRKVKFNR